MLGAVKVWPNLQKTPTQTSHFINFFYQPLQLIWSVSLLRYSEGAGLYHLYAIVVECDDHFLSYIRPEMEGAPAWDVWRADWFWRAKFSNSLEP